jgi:RimJ/RimL family protein N-acetyltransferase
MQRWRTVVVLEPIDEGNWQESLGVHVADEQLAFVADHQPVALVILAKCHLRPGRRRWEPLLIRDERGVAVGVVAVAHGPDDCEVRHFAIDVTSQGRGLGTAAVVALVGRARHAQSTCRALTVGAHPDNAVAQHIYRTTGFVETGEKRNGEPMFRLDVSRPAAP